MKNDSRRKALKAVALGATAWSKPVVDSIVLPTHANTSIVEEPGFDCPCAPCLSSAFSGSIQLDNVNQWVFPLDHESGDCSDGSPAATSAAFYIQCPAGEGSEVPPCDLPGCVPAPSFIAVDFSNNYETNGECRVFVWSPNPAPPPF